MLIFVWILLGALAGWIAFLAEKSGTPRRGLIGLVSIGIAGALLGGFSVSVLAEDLASGSNITSAFVAIIVSFMLLGIYKAVTSRGARESHNFHKGDRTYE